MLGAYNVMPEPRHVPVAVLHELGLGPSTVVDHLAGTTPVVRDQAVQLPPYVALWLTAE
jgi:amylosucrase